MEIIGLEMTSSHCKFGICLKMFSRENVTSVIDRATSALFGVDSTVLLLK